MTLNQIKTGMVLTKSILIYIVPFIAIFSFIEGFLPMGREIHWQHNLPHILQVYPLKLRSELSFQFRCIYAVLGAFSSVLCILIFLPISCVIDIFLILCSLLVSVLTKKIKSLIIRSWLIQIQKFFLRLKSDYFSVLLTGLLGIAFISICIIIFTEIQLLPYLIRKSMEG